MSVFSRLLTRRLRLSRSPRIPFRFSDARFVTSHQSSALRGTPCAQRAWLAIRQSRIVPARMVTTDAAASKTIKLELTELESTLRQLLLDVAHYINPESPSELRFTGGWVRDKLLGVGSHDIDVAINDMTCLLYTSPSPRD